jgi:hypothetical protein
MRTTATAIATRTAPRTSQRVRLQPARPCGCSRYVLIPLSTRLAPQRFHRPHFLMLFLHTRGGRRRAAEPAWDPRQNEITSSGIATCDSSPHSQLTSPRGASHPGAQPTKQLIFPNARWIALESARLPKLAQTPVQPGSKGRRSSRDSLQPPPQIRFAALRGTDKSCRDRRPTRAFAPDALRHLRARHRGAPGARALERRGRNSGG